MSSTPREVVLSAAVLTFFIADSARTEPLRASHPRNLYESYVDLSEDEACSIKAHLEHVEEVLRARDTTGMPSELRESRLRNLDRLRQYAVRGVFPRSKRFRGDLVPHFIDGGGRACAVAHLMIESGAEDVAREVARKANFAFLPDIDEPEAERWIEESGLTPEECAMIQPAYGRYWPSRFIHTGLDREGATRPGPVRVTVNQFDNAFRVPSELVETVRGPVDSGRVRAGTSALVEDLPSGDGSVEGVILRWVDRSLFNGGGWAIEYELDVDAGTFTFEGHSRLSTTVSVPTTGDTSVEIVPVPSTFGPFAAGSLEIGRSIGPDCPGTAIEEAGPGTYVLRAHGTPLVTAQDTFVFESDRLLFLYKEVWGDFGLTVTIPEDALANGVRGPMVRQDLDRRSPYVFLSERAPSRDVTLFIRSVYAEQFREWDSTGDPEEIHEIRDPRLAGGAFRTFRIERRDRRLSASVLDELGIAGEPESWVELEIPYEMTWHSPPRVLVGVAATSEQGCEALTTVTFTDVALEEGPPYEMIEMYRSGDSEPDGLVLISDAIRILGFLFLGEAPLSCPDAGDWNDDGRLDITDPVGILGWLFLGEQGRDFGCDIDRNPEEPPLTACAYPLDACR
jgi:hypothetical protein